MKDYFDFILKTKNILDENKIKALIQAGALDCFGLNHKTLEENIDNALNYAILQNGDETNLIRKPLIIEYDEYPKNELRLQELESFGFYINDHPCNIYEFPEYMKLKDLKKYLFKKVKCAILITNIKKIKTKNNKDMAFIDGNDDTDEASFTVFEQKIHLINDLEKNDVIIINGEVQKRYDQYSIIVSNINKVKK